MTGMCHVTVIPQQFIYLFIKSMNQHEYALNGITQQDLTVRYDLLATAGQNIATLHSAVK